MSKDEKLVAVQVVQHLSPGGIESMCLDLQKFRREGADVHIVSLEGEKQIMLDRWPRLRPYTDYLHFLGKPSGISFTILWKLVKLLRRLNASAVHTHHIGPMLYGGAAAKLAGVKNLIHTEHDAWHLENSRHRFIVNMCVRWFAPIVVADADIVAKQIHKRIPNARARVIHNGIDTGRFCAGDKEQSRRLLGLPPGVPLLGCAARLHAVKGHDVLIDALANSPKNLHLALAGEGEMAEKIFAQIKTLGLEERVHMLGQVEDMPAFYRAIDIFCLASKNEGMPLSPLEAQACGAPAIVTDVGACRETLCPKSGQLVAAGDVSSLTAAIGKSLSLLPALSPRDYIVENRDIKKMVSQYDQLISCAL